jgi:hypothetical protein
LGRLRITIPLQSWKLIPRFPIPGSSRRNSMDNQKVGDNLNTRYNISAKFTERSQSDQTHPDKILALNEYHTHRIIQCVQDHSYEWPYRF